MWATPVEKGGLGWDVRRSGNCIGVSRWKHLFIHCFVSRTLLVFSLNKGEIFVAQILPGPELDFRVRSPKFWKITNLKIFNRMVSRSRSNKAPGGEKTLISIFEKLCAQHPHVLIQVICISYQSAPGLPPGLPEIPGPGMLW